MFKILISCRPLNQRVERTISFLAKLFLVRIRRNGERSPGIYTQTRIATLCFRYQLGYTLIEILVVIGIVGILLAVSLPAVQTAREAMRRISCANNLKQVALAVHSYHDAHRKLPINIAPWTSGTRDIPQHNGKGWIASILPQLEQGNLYDELAVGFDGDFFSGGGLMNPEVRSAMMTQLSILQCPSDGSVSRISTDQFQWVGIDVALTSYKGVLGDSAIGFPDTIHVGSLPDCYTIGGCNGLFWRNDYREPQSLHNVTDGLSGTLLIGEDVASENNHSTAFYANSDWASCHAPINFFPTPSRPDDWWDVMSFRSRHVGGANFALADGSVRFLSESIDHDLYRALSTRRDGEVVTVP